MGKLGGDVAAEEFGLFEDGLGGFFLFVGRVPFPNQGHMRPDLTSRPLRFQTIRDYLIAYAPDEKPLVVIGVLHGRRSPRILAEILRERK
jgi:hypothetical protein